MSHSVTHVQAGHAGWAQIPIPFDALGAPIPSGLAQIDVQATVEKWWRDLAHAIENPAVERVVDGTRIVRVLEMLDLHFPPDAPAHASLLSCASGTLEWAPLDPAALLLAGMPQRDYWLDRWSESCRFGLLAESNLRGVALDESESRKIVNTVFAGFHRTIRCRFDLRHMRYSVAKALNLDAEAMDLANRMVQRLPRRDQPSSFDVRLADYVLALRFKDRLQRLHLELPVIFPLYCALLQAEAVNPQDDPAHATRQYLKEKGIRPVVWRLILKSSPRLFYIVRHFYAGTAIDAMVDLVWVLQELVIRQPPDHVLLWALLSRHATSASRRQSFRNDLPLVSYGVVFNAYLRLADREAMLDSLDTVLEWACTMRGGHFSKSQRKAGWPWLMARTSEWQAARLADLRSRRVKWATPMPQSTVPLGPGRSLHPLDSPLELWLEARAMRNCVESLQGSCERGEIALYSLRLEGRKRPLATIQLDRTHRGWELRFARGFANSEPAPEAVRVAFTLASQLCGMTEATCPSVQAADT